MNQQRSRRFRSAKEAKEKDEEKADFAKLLKQQNGGVLPEGVMAELNKKTWDSNAITPGTPFMDTLALSLRYWTAYKLNTDPAWEKVKVIISDATVPGEGEHKIMEFIRSQRSSPEHDPNTRHVIYGLDADLIMLGLATHEPHFRVLREDVFYQDSKPRTCKICGQTGHQAAECRGEAKVKQGEFDEKGKTPELKPFIWLHVSVLREYLAEEMKVPNQGFQFDLERALDDWVFMCFFVGNDFLPHLPSLDIREQGIDTLIAIWRDNMPLMGGYVTKDGHVDLERAQHILAGLAKQEDAIFKRRRQDEERKEANAKRRKMNEQQPNRRVSGKLGGGDNASLNAADFNLISTDAIRDSTRAYQHRHGLTSTGNASNITHDMVVNGNGVRSANQANKSAAAILKERLKSRSSVVGEDQPATEQDTSNDLTNGVAEPGTPPSASGKRKRELADDEDGTGTPGRKTPDATETPRVVDPDEPPPDTVRMWEEGYGDRYYEQKFHVAPGDHEFRHKVARAYVEGLAWVLLYYFQGCASWTWYYPYHYAPFAADFVSLGEMKIDFQRGIPFRPFEQLMGVMPAASNHTIPKVFHELMTSEDSDIVDFYPEDFPIDLNGKKWAWQGVALLPFIDEKRLLTAMGTKYPELSVDEQRRNAFGREALLFSDRHPLYETIATNFYSKKKGVSKHNLNPRISEGLAGKVEKNEDFLPQSSLSFPLPEGGMPDLEEDRSITVFYELPKSAHIHKSMLLRGVQFGPPALDRADIEMTRSRATTSGRSFGGAPFRGGQNGGYRGGRGGGGNGRGRGGYGGGQFSYAEQRPEPQRDAEFRPNPFAAHINPSFFPGGISSLPTPGAGGWTPSPEQMAAFARSAPVPPPGGIPGLNGYQGGRGPPPPPQSGGYGGYGNGGNGGRGGYRGGYGGGRGAHGGQGGY